MTKPGLLNHRRSLVSETLDGHIEPAAVAVIFGQAACPAILESSCSKGRYGRFSIFAADPTEVLEVPHDGTAANLTDLLARLAGDGSARGEPLTSAPGPGWIGFLGYEAGLLLEGLEPGTADRGAMPLARFARYDALALFDHQAARWSVIGFTDDEERIASVFARLEAARGISHDEPIAPPAISSLDASLSLEEYLHAVDKARDYIARGHIYQVNLTRRFTAHGSVDPLALYRRLRRASPSSHAAYLAWDDKAVLSASPELFLQRRGPHVVTRPIKGTRRRGITPAEDAALRTELDRSEKDEAELVMIVDLLRNDLGRVCACGTVRVTEPAVIEALPNVFHRVATIEGRLRGDATTAELIRATFPGGSITGCPKRRAMQIITELERTPRGLYCGAIGHIGLSGDLTLNVAIRTMIVSGDAVHLHAGGAITADSDPSAEHAELLAKARGMLEALGVPPPTESPAGVIRP